MILPPRAFRVWKKYSHVTTCFVQQEQCVYTNVNTFVWIEEVKRA